MANEVLHRQRGGRLRSSIQEAAIQGTRGTIFQGRQDVLLGSAEKLETQRIHLSVCVQRAITLVREIAEDIPSASRPEFLMTMSRFTESQIVAIRAAENADAFGQVGRSVAERQPITGRLAHEPRYENKHSGWC